MDPKYSMWFSTDPALGDYIPKAPINEEAKKHNQNLPDMGGVFNHINGDLYAYAGNNPVRYIDPDGREVKPYSIYNSSSLALKYELELISIDAATPEPTDAIPHKWMVVGGVVLGTAIVAGLALFAYKISEANSNLDTSLPPGYSINGAGIITGPNGILPSPSDAWDEYNGDDHYKSNPKHHQNAKGKASREPKNAEQMFYRSVRDPRSGHERTRWYKDRNGHFHRFQGSNNEYHWNGSTDNGTRLEDVPAELRKSLKEGDL